MSNVDYATDEYITFTDKEEKLIDEWLEKHGYKWGRASLCGSCCGFYRDTYWVGGIGGKWQSQKDLDDFVKYCRKNSIPVRLFSYDIEAAEEGVTIDESWKPSIKRQAKPKVTK